MAPKVQVQPGFMPPGDDVMALVNEVGNSLKAILKNEQTVADLKKSEKVVTSDPQTVKSDGKKGSGEHVATSDPQVGLGKGEFSSASAERSGSETSSSGGGRLPVKPSGMAKASPSASESSGDYRSPESSGGMSKAEPGEGSPPSPSASAGSPSGSPSAGEGSPGEGSPAGAPPAGDPSAPAGGEAPAAAPSFEELVQMYSQLTPEDLQAHMAAIEQAAQGQAGAAPGAPAGAPPSPGAGPGMPPSAGPGPSAPPPSAGPGMPPGAGPGLPPSPGPEMPPMGKSEAAGYMAELKKTQDQVGAIAEALTAVLTLPKRKAVDGLHIVPFQKSEAPLAAATPSFEELKKNPAALHAELKKMTLPDSSLKKSERDLVTDFYCRRISVEELAPLFQVKK